MLVFFLLLFPFFINSVWCLQINWFYTFLNQQVSTNPDCETQKNAFLDALENNETWALKMMDASGRIPQAITQGNRRDGGTYDQCVNIQENLDIGELKGKYCYAGLAIPLSVLINITSFSPETLINQVEIDNFPWEALLGRTMPSMERRVSSRETEIDDIFIEDPMLIALCLPNACTPSDLFDPLGFDDLCQTKDQNKVLDAGDIVCLILLLFVLILMIASSVYDLYLKKHSKGPVHPIFVAFSVITNGSKIISTQRQSGQIDFFNGLKVLSMFWIIMGHRYAGSDSTVVNKDDVASWRRKWYSCYVLSAHLAVDTFLFISGVLLSYIFLKTMRKPNQKFNVFLYYLHRYLRLTPALGAVYLVQITLMRRITSGPLYTYFIEDVVNPTCLKNWWAFFLYIQNYITRENLCLIHTWYLSMDMQFFIISPLLLLPMLHYGKRMYYVGMPVLTVLAIVYTMVLFNIYNIKLWTYDYYQLYYYASHNRLPAWFIGLIFGAFLLDYQNNEAKYQIRSKLMVTVLWITTTALVLFLLLIQDNIEYEHTRLKATFYFPLLRPTWALCLCWISYACLSGNAASINSFLSAPIFQVLSKITYSTYLVHISLIYLHVGYVRTLPYFAEYDTIRVVLADICVSYFTGALWALAFESPMIVIERIVFGADKERKAKEVNKADGSTNVNKTNDV